MVNSQFLFSAIGTEWVINITSDKSPEEICILENNIKERISLFDKAYSRFRKDSLVSEISLNSGEYVFPEDADKMFVLYKKMFDVTAGKVTPLIGQAISEAGYDAEYSLVEKEVTAVKQWDEVMKWNNPVLHTFSPVLLDFGGGGKGYIVDIISEMIEEFGISSYCVDAGGDMRQRNRGGTPLRVGLENPLDTSEVIGVTILLDRSLCGSSGSRRKWGKFHHIIDPDTLTSPREIIAVWTLADTTMLADLLTTALFFIRPEVLLEHFNFEFIIIYDDKSVSYSDKCGAEFFN